MVVGCILCDQPLVTRIQPGATCRASRRVFSKTPKPKPKIQQKRTENSAAGCASSSHPPRHPFLPYQPSFPALNHKRPAFIHNSNMGASVGAFGGPRPTVFVSPPPAHNDFEVLAAKCGHMFHQICLKTYIATRINLAAGNKRPCPFCDKFITLAHCSPVQLLVPDSHYILDDLSGLLQQNENLQRQVEHVRTAVKAEKLKELEEIQKQVKEREMELGMKHMKLDRLRGWSEGDLRRLQLEQEAVQEENKQLEAQNRELIQLIEEAVKIRNKLGSGVSESSPRPTPRSSNLLPVDFRTPSPSPGAPTVKLKSMEITSETPLALATLAVSVSTPKISTPSSPSSASTNTNSIDFVFTDYEGYDGDIDSSPSISSSDTIELIQRPSYDPDVDSYTSTYESQESQPQCERKSKSKNKTKNK